MLTRDQVTELLRNVTDPGLGRRLVEMNMIRDIMVREGSVSLTAAVSENRDDWKRRVEQEIRSALEGAGVQDVHVRVREMTPYEKQQVSPDGGGRRTNIETPHTQDKPPLLDPSSGVQFIAIASGKGGVGKSTVSVNLAVALARLGKRVGLVDADIYGFSVPDMMGIETRPNVVGERVYPVERFGVKVISMGFFVEDNSPVIWRGPMLGKMLRNFFREVEWGELDYMLLDLPPGTGDVALDVHQMIPQSKEILVTTPHATAAFVAARAGAMARRTEHEVLGVVENMAYFSCGQCGHKEYVFGRGGGAKLAQELGTELLAQIPLGDPDNHPSEPDYSPSVYKPDSEIGKLYTAMAERVVALTT